MLIYEIVPGQKFTPQFYMNLYAWHLWHVCDKNVTRFFLVLLNSVYTICKYFVGACFIIKITNTSERHQ